MNFKIEKNVPRRPNRKETAMQMADFFSKMEPGDSFLLTEKEAPNLRYHATQYAKTDLTFDWEMRREDVKHIRFWRIKVHQ